MNDLSLLKLNWSTKKDRKTKKGIVYRFCCVASNKNYIGVTLSTFNKRYGIKQSSILKQCSNQYFKNAIKKYGIENFLIEIIEYDKNEAELNLLEAYYIKHFKSNIQKYGYNLTSGGFLKHKHNSLRNKKRRITHGEFVKRAKNIHKDKYIYTSINYRGMMKKVKIICKLHGSFRQTPCNHLDGHGCPNCCKTPRLNTKLFIIKAREKHQYKYNYDKTKYTNSKSKVTITCFQHGDFYQNTYSHLNGSGCPECSYEDNSFRFASQQTRTDRTNGKKRIYQIDPISNKIMREFPSMMEAERIFKEHGIFISFKEISRACIKKVICKGYKWVEVDKYILSQTQLTSFSDIPQNNGKLNSVSNCCSAIGKDPLL